MSTRSRIAIKKHDGTIASIYCHFDGYPQCTGSILQKHFKDPAKINQLMELGDLSCIAPEIGKKHDFDNPNPNWCLAYGRDRGEGRLEPQTHSTERDLLDATTGSWGQYAYLFDGREWKMCNLYESKSFVPLKEVLEKIF